MAKYVKLMALCVVVLALLLVAATGSGLKSLDVVGRNSVTMFGEILKSVETGGTDTHWSLAAPDNSARFAWSRDFTKSDPFDVMLEVDAAPFVKAGLDPAKLPPNYRMDKGVLTVGTELAATGGTAPSTALDAYARLVDAHRGVINYHSFLDHYGVKVGGGNMFEWAKDLATNAYDNTGQDKDIVFALNPHPLVQAGLDPEIVEGWAYAQVPVETDAGIVMEWNLLKPFDLQ